MCRLIFIPPNGPLDQAYFYVSLSRAKTLKDIANLRKFDNSIFSVPISNDLKIKMARLLDLEKSCLTKI